MKREEEVLRRTIESLRQEQEVTKGMEWFRLEEEIQELLDEEENEKSSS